MGGTSQDVKRLKKWDFTLYSMGFINTLPFSCLHENFHFKSRVILCQKKAYTKAMLSDFN